MSNEEEKLEGEIESALQKLELIKRHKLNVIDNAEILARKLIELGEIDFGIKLICSSWTHDLSKYFSIEWKWLLQDKDKEMLKLAMEDHRAKNPHHPEYWGGIDNMPVFCLAELVCDLKARSAEQGTCLKDFLKDIYYPKHNIKLNSKVDKQIRRFVDLLLDDSFVKLK